MLTSAILPQALVQFLLFTLAPPSLSLQLLIQSQDYSVPRNVSALGPMAVYGTCLLYFGGFSLRELV